jgi:predicted nucleic acid-binding protein
VTRVVVDASVLAAVAFGEPDASAWTRRLEGTTVFAPRLLQYELQSVARKKCRRHPEQASQIVSALAAALDTSLGITWINPDPADVVLLAHATGLTAYDASYLCAAAMTGADLLTADEDLAAAVDPFVMARSVRGRLSRRARSRPWPIARSGRVRGGPVRAAGTRGRGAWRGRAASRAAASSMSGSPL